MSMMASHQLHECLLSRLFGRKLKKTPKLRVTGLCAGNSPVTSEFPAQRASNAENIPFDDVIMVYGIISSHLTLTNLIQIEGIRICEQNTENMPYVLNLAKYTGG